MTTMNTNTQTLPFLSILKKRQKAWQFDFGKKGKVWLPTSVISISEHTVTMPMTLYEKHFKNDLPLPFEYYERNGRVVKIIREEGGKVLYQYQTGKARFEKSKFEFYTQFTPCEPHKTTSQ